MVWRMRIVSKRKLEKFCKRYADAEQYLLSWFRKASAEDWRNPQEVKAKYGNVKIIKGNRAIFKIKGNKYRLVVKINYRRHAVYIRFVGTHEQYDSIDAEIV